MWKVLFVDYRDDGDAGGESGAGQAIERGVELRRVLRNPWAWDPMA